MPAAPMCFPVALRFATDNRDRAWDSSPLDPSYVPDRQGSGGGLASANRPPITINLRKTRPTAPCLSWSRSLDLVGVTSQARGQPPRRERELEPS
jgi:hypothetical protein